MAVFIRTHFIDIAVRKINFKLNYSLGMLNYKTLRFIVL